MTARGAFVVIIGPDGVGKTTLARNLIARWPSATMYIHFRPSILARPDATPGDEASVPPIKRINPGPRPIGWLRLLWSVFVFAFGYWRWLRPALHRGALIVGDRWIYGYVGQPTALGFGGPAWLADIAIQLVPNPDLLVRLKADPVITAQRKGDLSPQEIEAEDQRWDGLSRLPFVVDANQPHARVVDDVADELLRKIESRQATACS